MTTTINIAEAKEEFSELINRVAHSKERIVITRRDKEVAAIIPLEDLHVLQNSQNKSDLHDATEALKEARLQGSVTLDELKDNMG